MPQASKDMSLESYKINKMLENDQFGLRVDVHTHTKPAPVQNSKMQKSKLSKSKSKHRKAE
jgi:hypothetical protein